jgi:hypothetical protein
VHGLVWLQLRLLAWQPAHGSATCIPSLVRSRIGLGLQLRNHREQVEQEPSARIGGVVNRAAEAELDVSSGQLIEYVARIWS